MVFYPLLQFLCSFVTDLYNIYSLLEAKFILEQAMKAQRQEYRNGSLLSLTSALDAGM
jgi:hypothetical protein